MSATILDAFEYAISQGYTGTQAEFTELMSLALKYEKTTRKDLGRATAYGYAKSKGYTGTEEQFAELMASYATVAEEAADSASEAEGYAEDSQEWSVESEAWAVGQRNGASVDSEDPAYHNNSKYYKERAEELAEDAAISAATFTTDTSLTVAGKAADAKVTGNRLAGIAAAVGSPLVITDPDDFDNASHTRVYVYAGTTTSLYTNGDWYYWDGDGWENGGVYNSVAVDTDDTLSVSGMAADAAAVGEVAEEVTDLKSAIKNAVDDVNVNFDTITGTKIIDFTDGYYIATNLSVGDTVDLDPNPSNAGFGYAIVNVTAGQKVTISGTGGVTPRLWCFVDSANRVIDVSNSEVPVIDLRLVAPTNATKLIINAKDRTKDSYVNEFIKNLVSTNAETINDVIDVLFVGDHKIVFTYGSIDEIGANVDSETRLRTDYIESGVGAIISAIGYDFVLYAYDKTISDDYVESYVGRWNGSAFVTQSTRLHNVDLSGFWTAYPNYRYRIMALKSDNTAITQADITAYYKFELSPLLGLYDKNEIEIQKLKATAELQPKRDGIYSWWTYPIIEYYKGVRNNIYVGYTTADGYSGVVCIDVDTHKCTYKDLKNADTDDHNAVAVKVMNDGKIMCAYSGGHDYDRKMHVIISTVAESIERFTNPVMFESPSYATSYAQILESNGTYYLFYRLSDTGVFYWAVRTSTDGVNWSAETKLFHSTVQYYCLFRETNTVGTFRVIMTSNPNAGDSNFRQAFLHVNGNSIAVYNSDNSTQFDTVPVEKADVTIIVPVSTGVNRLFDVAVSDISSPMILYAVFTDGGNNNSVYKMYNAGTTTTICNGGLDIYTGKYQLGACFVGSDKIAVTRTTGAYTNVVEIRLISNISYVEKTLTTTKYTNAYANNRCFRPASDSNGNYISYCRGYYNPQSFNDFNTDIFVRIVDV